jgi:hypothetical protein
VQLNLFSGTGTVFLLKKTLVKNLTRRREQLRLFPLQTTVKKHFTYSVQLNLLSGTVFPYLLTSNRRKIRLKEGGNAKCCHGAAT